MLLSACVAVCFPSKPNDDSNDNLVPIHECVCLCVCVDHINVSWHIYFPFLPFFMSARN